MIVKDEWRREREKSSGSSPITAVKVERENQLVMG